MTNIDSKPLENLARASLAQDREIAMLRRQLSNARDELSFVTTEYNDVLDVLIAADMWTGNPPYRGVSAAGQVQMILDELAKFTAERDELSAQRDALQAKLDAVREQFAALKSHYDVVFDSRDETHRQLVDAQKKLDAVPVDDIGFYFKNTTGSDALHKSSKKHQQKFIECVDIVADWLQEQVQP